MNASSGDPGTAEGRKDGFNGIYASRLGESALLCQQCEQQGSWEMLYPALARICANRSKDILGMCAPTVLSDVTIATHIHRSGLIIPAAKLGTQLREFLNTPVTNSHLSAGQNVPRRL